MKTNVTPLNARVGSTRSQVAIEQHWGRFQQRVFARVQQGAKDYGDRSFEAPIPEIIDEIQQELEDVNGWSFIAWSRLETLRRELEKSKAAV